MQFNRGYLRRLVISLCAVATLGCTTALRTPTGPVGPPSEGGTLRLAVSGDPTCLDPQQSGIASSLSVGAQIVDSLTAQDPRSGDVLPWIAQRWQVSPDAREFTFTLRPDATFSDGHVVDASSVRTNFDNIAALGPKSAVGSTFLSGYLGTQVIDPRTLKVTFSQPNAQFLQATSTVTLGLLSPQSYAVTAEERCQGKSLVGSGPFVLGSYVADQEVRVTKRAGYQWPASNARHTGAAYLDAIEFAVIPESGVRAGALVSGELDAAIDIQPQDEKPLQHRGLLLSTHLNPGIPLTLIPNASTTTLRDARVRQALSLGINRDSVVHTTLSPKYRSATGYLASATPMAIDQSQTVRFDPALAKQLLEEAGWVPGPEGIRVRSGKQLRLEVIFGPEFGFGQNALQLIQQDLRAIGVDIQLRQLAVGDAVSRQAAGRFDLTLVSLTRADPDVLRMTYSTRSRNPGRVPPGPLDDLLERQASGAEPTTRSASVARALETLAANSYAIPICELSQVIGINPRVRGIAFDGSSRLRLYDSWIVGGTAR